MRAELEAAQPVPRLAPKVLPCTRSAGTSVGGRTYGYKNRAIYNGSDRDGNPVRSHVVREVDPAEAAVVRGRALRTVTRSGAS